MAVAHDFSGKARTNDVLISESIDFAGLLLSKPVLNGLKNAGFERPSPIQLKAIPLGRCGLDLIVQAKSGTGKTCVFSVVALEGLKPTASSTQVLVLAPTREIALQIWEVICSIGSAMQGLCCHTFIGGMPVHEDKKKLQKCHIAVGTPGRIQSLIQQGLLKTKSIRLFVLDEADKLLEEGFQKQINWIYSALPDNKQMLALSATYPEYLAEHLTLYMRNPTFVRLNITDPTLLGIKQYYTMVPSHPLPNRVFEAKTAAVIKLLSSVTFNQCLIFSNLQTRAQNLQNELSYQGWPTSCIAGCLDQKDRIIAITKLKSYSCRILISTDLTSRGIDADRVNLVINLDVPHDHETYLHRIGRAGRFGSYGAGVSIVSDGQELADLHKIERNIGTHVLPLPDPIPQNLVKLQLPVNLEDVVSTERIITRSEDCAVSSADLSHISTPQSVNPADITVQSAISPGSNGHVDQCTDIASCLEEGDVAVSSEDQTVGENRQTDRPELSANGDSGSVDESKNRGSEKPGMARIETDTDVHVRLESGRRQTTEKRGSDCSSDSLETTSAQQRVDASVSSDVTNAEASSVSSDFRFVNGGHHTGPEDSKEHCSNTNERKDQENKSDIVEETNLQQSAAAPHKRLARSSDSEAASTGVTPMANSADTGDNAVYNRKTSQSSESAVKPETEQSQVKKNHKGRATGDLWASILLEQDREETPVPQQDTPPPSVSNKKQACTRQNSSEKRGKKAVSWDKELELYLAARSKVGSVSENSGEDGQELGTGVSAVANRPMKRATRHCPEAKQKKPAPSGAENCLNGQAEVGASKAECKDHSALTLSSIMAQKEEGREKGREAACLNGDGSEHHLTMESERQSSQKSFGKPDLSKDPEVQAAFLASAEQHGLKEVLLQHKSHVPPPKILVCKKQAKRSAVPQTYMSLLQNYRQYLEKTDTPPMKTIPSIVQQTFSMPPAPEENQRQMLLQFLGHFYTQWDRTHPTDMESVDKDANGDGKERQREVRSKLTVETVSMKTNDKNTFEFNQKHQTMRTEKKKGQESGGRDGLDMAVNSADSTISTARTEPKSSTVNASSDHRGKEDHAAATVKRKEESVEKKKRVPRYRPMAVFGPATLHLFQSKDNTGESASTSEVLSPDRSNDTTNTRSFSEFQNGVCVSQKTLPGLQSNETSHDSIGPEKAENSLTVNGFVSTGRAVPKREPSRSEDRTGPFPGRQNTGDMTVRQKAVSNPAALSSLGKGAIPKQRHAELPQRFPVLNGVSPVQPHSKLAGKPTPKGAIPKQPTSGGRKKVQSSDEDSSSDDDSSSSSSSTSTANEEAFPRTEGLEEKLMCFQNQYAVETSVHGRAKKLGPKARTGRKGKEERLKLQTELSSSQEDRLEKRQHRRWTRSGMGSVNTAEANKSIHAGEFSWYPYSLENNSSDYYTMQNADQCGVDPQHSYPPSFFADRYPSAWSSHYPGMSSYTAHKLKKGQRHRDEGLPYTEYGQQGHTGSHSDWYSHAEQNQSYPYPASWQTTGYTFPPSSQGPGHPYPMSHQSSAYSSSVCQNPEYPTWQQYVGYTHPASQQNRGTPYPASQQSQGSPYHTWQQSQGYPHPFSQQNPRSYPPSQNQGSFQMHGSPYRASLHNQESPYLQSQWTSSDTYQQNQSGYYQPAEYQPWQRADLQAGHPSVAPSVEDLAQAQAAKAQSLNSYIRSMSKFYARFCAHTAS